MIKNTVPECPYCGSLNVNYLAVDDSGGDYGDAFCDIYECWDCGNEFEAHCVEIHEEQEDE